MTILTASTENLQESTVVFPGSYNSANVNLGPLIVQNSGGGASNWCGPCPPGIGRIYENQTITPWCTASYNWSTTTDWFFVAANSTASTLIIGMYLCNRTTGVFTYQGYITITQPQTGSTKYSGMRVAVYTHTEGTVAVSGTGVTGTSTTWAVDRLAAGARIGFGSTNPSAISQWYNISTVGGDTSITLGTSAGTIAGGSSYVIEEIRLVMSGINSSSTFEGLYLTKGLNYSTFSVGGTTIAAAVSTDNIRATYYLKDASTGTVTTACGIALSPTSQSNTNHYCYVLQGSGTTNIAIYQYNIRAALTVSGGIDTANAFITKTGVEAVTTTMVPASCLCFATDSHGQGSGVASLYVSDVTKIYRIAEANVTSASTTFISDNSTPVLPTSLPLAGQYAFGSIDYDSVIDRFVLGSTSALANFPAMTTRYDTSANLLDSIWPLDSWLSEQSAVSSLVPSRPSVNLGTGYNTWVSMANGMAYLTQSATSSLLNASVWNLPLAAHWDYSVSTGNSTSTQTNGVLVTPSINTSGCTQFYNVYVNEVQNLGDPNWGWSPEPYNMYYRTSGISDNSGSWTLLGDDHNLSAVGAANAIQFKFTFRVSSKSCIPARIIGLDVTYNSGTYLPSWLEWNDNDSNYSNGTYGITQITTYGYVPVFTITYYREDTNAVLFSQASSGTTNGTWYYYSSGWVAGTGTDTAGERRQFVPTASLPSGVNIFAVVSTS